MHKFNYFCSIVLVVTLPLMIVILTSNLILRVSATYTYHFNDSQVMDEVPYSITGTEMGSEIASYWSSFRSEDFQVYEENGVYKDPVFQSDEQQVMRKTKNRRTSLSCNFFSDLYLFTAQRFQGCTQKSLQSGSGTDPGAFGRAGGLLDVKGVQAASLSYADRHKASQRLYDFGTGIG